MGNGFRRALSLVLLAVMALIIYQFTVGVGTQPGMAGQVLNQAMWLFGLIAAALAVAWYFRSR